MDLVQTGEAVETEKDDLLEKVCTCCTPAVILCPGPKLANMQFMEFAKGVCNKATDRGHWADYIDPCSGLPVGICLECSVAACHSLQHGLTLSAAH